MVFKEKAYLEVFPKQVTSEPIKRESMIEDDEPGGMFKDPNKETKEVREVKEVNEPEPPKESMLEENEDIEEGEKE